MPVQYKIDDPGLVVSRAWGTLTVAEIHSHQDQLRSDEAFDPNGRQLVDLSDVGFFEVHSNGIRSIVLNDVWGPKACRAFVGARDLTFGIARMHEVCMDGSGQRIMVVRTTDEAYGWLESVNEGSERRWCMAPDLASL